MYKIVNYQARPMPSILFHKSYKIWSYIFAILCKIRLQTSCTISAEFSRELYHKGWELCWKLIPWECDPKVTALLDFLNDLNYPLMLASQWFGNETCTGLWLGLSCNPKSKILINFQKTWAVNKKTERRSGTSSGIKTFSKTLNFWDIKV